MKTLYICYFGLNEPLVQTQVLPYLREMARGGLEVYLMTFEPDLNSRWPQATRQAEQTRLDAEGIRWFALAYHKRPTLLATLFDAVTGTVRANGLIRRHGIDVVHARSHVPGLMAMWLKRLTKCRVVFDLRGLMAEEYQDAGVWKTDSLPFRLTKRIERAIFSRADRIITLTDRAAQWLIEQGVRRERVHVIPCCVDISRFNAIDDVEPEHRKLQDYFTVVYAGSVVGLYLLRDMMRFIIALRKLRPDAHFLVLTAGDNSLVRAAATDEGLPENALTVLSVAPEKVARYLKLARAGLSFRKPTFSQIAASPTKVPEYLAAGIPVVTNAGIGDTDEVVRSTRTGVILQDLSEYSLAHAAEELLELLSEGDDLQSRCMDTARRRFSLEEVGGPRYLKVYESLGLKPSFDEPAALSSNRQSNVSTFHNG